MFLKGHKFSQDTLEKLRKPHLGHFKKGVLPITHKKGCSCLRCTKKPNETSFKKGNVPWNKSGKYVKCHVCSKKIWIKPSRTKTQKRFFCSRTCSGLYRKGKLPWNKGKKGFQIAWNKGKKRPEISGDKHPNWQGGKTSRNTIIRHSFEMKTWRKAVFERDNYTCVWCGERGGKLNADHIKPFALYPNLRFELSNGRTLCEECHKTTSTYLLKTYTS